MNGLQRTRLEVYGHLPSSAIEYTAPSLEYLLRTAAGPCKLELENARFKGAPLVGQITDQRYACSGNCDE